MNHKKSAAGTETRAAKWRKTGRKVAQARGHTLGQKSGKIDYAGPVSGGQVADVTHPVRAMVAPPQTAADVLALWRKEGVLGAWSDRQDIGDSSEYARTLREQAQTRDWSGE